MAGWFGGAPFLAGSRAQAARVSYDGTASGLAATDVQAGLDEIAARLDIQEAAIDEITARLGILDQSLAFLDTFATPGHVTALAQHRFGRAQMPAASIDITVNHPRLTANSFATMWIGGSTARVFYPFARSVGSITFRTTSNTALEVWWMIHMFGDEDA